MLRALTKTRFAKAVWQVNWLYIVWQVYIAHYAFMACWGMLQGYITNFYTTSIWDFQPGSITLSLGILLAAILAVFLGALVVGHFLYITARAIFNTLFLRLHPEDTHQLRNQYEAFVNDSKST